MDTNNAAAALEILERLAAALGTALPAGRRDREAMAAAHGYASVAEALDDGISIEEIAQFAGVRM